MNKVRKLAIGVLLFAPLLAWAGGSATELGDDASRILGKMRKLDLLNQILPVVMTQDQIKKLLPTIEKARSAAISLEKSELEEMKKLEAKLDTAIEEASTKQQIPPTELQNSVRDLLREFQKKRAIMVAEQNEIVLKAVEETLNEGQIKSATNALSVPAGETPKPTDRERLSRWVRGVLMDPQSYDILVELSKKG